MPPVLTALLHPPGRLDGYAGSVQLDEAEVSAVEWVALPELRRRAQERPQEFTQVGGAGRGRAGGAAGAAVVTHRCMPHNESRRPACGPITRCPTPHPGLRTARPSLCVLQWFLDEVRLLSWFGADGRQDATAAGQQAAKNSQAAAQQAAAQQSSEQLVMST